MLTHEAATAEETVPYLEQVMWPLPVVNLYGRSARLHPPIAKEEAVWYGWKDAASVLGPIKPCLRVSHATL